MTDEQIQIRNDFIRVLSMGSERAVADLAVDLVNQDAERFRIVYELCFSEKYPLSMRAARVIQLCCGQRPSLLQPYLNEAMEKCLQSPVIGVTRSFLKIFAENVDLTLLKNPGILLDRCFTYLSDASRPPALRIYSIMIVYKFSLQETDLQHELREILEFLPDDEHPSIKSRASWVLKRIP